MPIWQLCANLLIPNCLRSNLSYSPLAALELYAIMENSLSDELFCSLKNELREVDAQISVHSKKLLELIDQKKELSSN